MKEVNKRYSYEKVDKLNSLTNELRNAISLSHTLDKGEINRITVRFTGREGVSLTEVDIYDADIKATIAERLKTRNRAILECLDAMNIPGTATELLARRNNEINKPTNTNKEVN